MTHFTADNTEGFTQAQLDVMNAEFDALIADYDRDAPDYNEMVKQISDQIFTRYC